MPPPETADHHPAAAGPTPGRVHPSATLALLSALLLAPTLGLADGTQTTGLSAPPPGPNTRAELAPTDRGPPTWLDEVRAQRQAAEERHLANRDAFAARRRTTAWGATRHDARELEVQRRRTARKQRIEEDRERFRTLGAAYPSPWTIPESPQAVTGTDQPAPTAAATQPETPADPTGAFSRVPPPPASAGHNTPQDWDNLWYYRGY